MRKLKYAIAFFLSITFAQPSHGAIFYDSVNDNTTCGTSDLLLPNGSPWSAYALMKPQTIGEGSAGRIFHRQTGGFVGQVQFFTSGTNALSLSCNGTTDMQRVSNSNMYNMNEWSAVLITGDGGVTASNYHIYVNGAEVTYATTTNGVALISNSGSTMNIGSAGGGNNTFDGQIDEVAIWNVQLSKDDAIKLTSSKVRRMAPTIRSANLQGYWNMDEFGNNATASGASTIKDRSGNGRHCTPGGGALGKAGFVTYP